MTKYLALKVDVDTLRGTVEGVPNLLRLFDKLNIRATFLFSLGPDHTGRAIKRIFRPGFFAKVQRTSVVEHYGLKTLLYGTVLPGPDIGVEGATIMRDTRCAGHEVGIHTWDHVLWQDHVRNRDEEWTRRQMQQAYDRFVEVFGSPPETHGAAGWQMNDYALRQLDDWGMTYASDGRGSQPFRPVLGDKQLSCVQLPTTLPTLDELIGVEVNGKPMDSLAAAEHLLQLTAKLHSPQVFTLHTELEGAKLQPAFERLLNGWQEQGFTLSSLKDYYTELSDSVIPGRAVWGSIPGRSGELIVQQAA